MDPALFEGVRSRKKVLSTPASLSSHAVESKLKVKNKTVSPFVALFAARIDPLSPRIAYNNSFRSTKGARLR